ncbi:ATP-binding cassette domain-containing protein [Saccharothrix sp. ST-888]|uniref:ATP-binding cassette domain-containing protein n=1 Tax=Saccharothrix sp. ST-888 TaxID=1427391 RepID=UPI000698BEAE|nr:ATP-binding cassette domain-containing protein [Saccharothrix sp. ST-888]
MLRLEAVSKRYGRGEWIVRDVHAEIPGGEITTFAGGNGSGKSTLLRILVGVSRPTSGVVSGRPRLIGYVPDRFVPNGRMSAAAYLTHMGRIRGLTTRAAETRAHHLLDRLSLVGGKEARLHTLSKGNAQKVALAQALLVEPELLVLDEPWSGLGASAHGILAEIMSEVARSGGSVVFTDHREAVTRVLPSRAYTVGNGGVVLRSPQAQDEHRPVTEIVLVHPDGAHPDGAHPGGAWLDGIGGVRSVEACGAHLVVRVDRDRADSLLLTALQKGWSVVAVTREDRSRDDRSHDATDAVAARSAR